jgi:hypothetical protein
MSFPKAIQVMRDSGGRARRAEWDEGDFIEIAPVPWNGEQEALLHHRPADRRRNNGPDVVTIFQAFGHDIRAIDWRVDQEQQP